MPQQDSAAPLVSVITPAYNAAAFIEQCVASVQAQTFRGWEQIIVDDRSKDSTREIVQRLRDGDPRIRYLLNDSNVGVAETRNRAISEARGQYLAFLDSDDLWMPEKLSHQVEFMRSTGAAFSFTAYRRVSESGDREGEIIRVPATVAYSDLLKRTSIGCLTVMLDLNQTGLVKMERIKHEDYVLWLSLLRRGFTARGLNEDLARYRVVKTSITNNKFKSFSWVWNIYRNVEHLGLLRSAFYFLHYVAYAAKKGRTL